MPSSSLSQFGPALVQPTWKKGIESLFCPLLFSCLFTYVAFVPLLSRFIRCSLRFP